MRKGAAMRHLFILILTLAISHMPFAMGSSFANETDADVPLSGISASLQPDLFTGTLTGSIPIDVSPGRNGMQPNVMLAYESAGGNGWLGMGWKLEIGTIERQIRWGVLYSPTVQEELDGKVYTIRLDGVSTDLVQDATDPLLYHEKVKSSFLRIRKLSADGTAGWEITNAKGTKYKFGTGATTRIQGTVPGLGTQIFKWCLERVEDRDGNYMTITYQGDGTTNQGYLSQINYTGNGATAPTNQVKFYLENRPDAPDMYTSNFKIKTAKRLKTVEVKTNGILVRAYGLTYTTSGNTSRSRLVTIRQFGKDAAVDVNGVVSGGASLPEINLGWKDGAPGSLSSQGSVIPNQAWTSPRSGDFNGDGRTDFIINEVNSAGTIYRTYLSNGNGSFTSSGFSFYDSSHSIVLGSAQSPMPGDFDGDGQTDFLINFLNAGWRTVLSDGDGTFTDVLLPGWLLPYTFPDLWHSPMPGDFNGDGRTDILINAGTEVRAYLSNGNGAFSYASTVITPGYYWGNPTPGDFNGDGQTDFLMLQVYPLTGWHAYLSNGNGTFSYVSTVSFNPQMSGDFNGDGRTDFLTKTITDYSIYLSNGDGTFSYASTVITSASGWSSPMPDDFNGDGRTDFLINTGTEWRTYLSNGDGTISFASTVSPNEVWSSPMPGDFDGDGKGDFIINTQAGWHEYLANTVGGGVPDLLNSVANGLGGLFTITYVPSTQYANTGLLYPLQTVSAITRCDHWNGTSCAGTSSTTSYTYDGGYHNLGNRDFRGFKHVTVTSPTGPNGERTTTETWFHQGAGTGPTEDTGSALTHPDAPTKGRPYRIVVRDSGQVPQIETLTTYATDANGLAPWFTPSSQVVTRTYANGAIAKTTQVNFTYDHTYGTVVREDHQGDTSLTGDEKTIERTFANESTAWLIGFPTRETIYKGISIAVQDKVAETLFYYDGTITCATASTLQVPTLGHLTRTVSWLNGGTNPETRMAYDAYGNRTCTRDPNGNITTASYDPSKTFILITTQPLGIVTTTVYYGVNSVLADFGLYGQVKSVTDPNSKITTSTYDVFGRNLATTAPDGLVSTMAYNYGGTFVVGAQHIQSTTSGGGLSANLVSKTYFDGLGRTIKKESPGAADGGAALKVLVTETQYDARGLIKQSSLPYIQGLESATGRWSIPTYDALGRTIDVQQPNNTHSKVCYSGWVTTTIDPKLHKKVETKDAYGRVSIVKEYTGTQADCLTAGGILYATTTYTYNLVGNLLSVTDTNGNVSSMTYDTLGRKLTMHDPDMGNWSYTYDTNGNLLTQVDAKNQKLCFTYDALNRRTQKNYGTNLVACGTNTVVYSYDDTVAANNGKGRLKQVTDPAQSITFQYDSQGRVKQSAKTLDGTTYTTTSVYDGLGRLTSVSYPTTPIKTVTYTYDGPQLKRVSEGATNYVTYAGWNALGQPETDTFGNGVVTTRTYHPQTFRLQTLATVPPVPGSPTAPATLTATPVAASTTQLNLSWSAATDNVGVTGYRIERCQGVGCTTFVEVGTTAAGVLTFSNTGLTTGNPYTYRVRAYDALSNLGAYSPTATAMTTDTTPPNVEGGVGIMIVSTSQIDLTWEQPTEGSYLWNYRLERCQGSGCTNFVEIAATTVTRYSDTGLTPATSYRYRVRCLDYAGNAGGYSSIYTKTTTLPADVTPPTAPGSLTATPVPSARIDLSWTAATDAGGITDYRIERCRGVGCSDFVQIARTTPPTVTYSNQTNGLWDGTSYTYRVRATDATGNFGVYSTSATAVTTDSVNPTVSGTPLAMANGTQAVLTWTRSTDLSNAVQYQVERCQGVGCTTFALVKTVPLTTLTDTGLTASTTYRYRVRAVDSTNHLSGYSAVGTTTTGVATAVQALTYSYDTVGNVTGITDNVTATNSQTLTYDDLDRLDQATGNYGFYDFAYDAIGNMTTNPQLTGGTMTYPASGTGSIRPHAVSTAGGNTYTYDANGNMLTGAGRTFTWNQENKPLTIIQGGVTTTFVYDGDGGRVKKVAGTTTTRYLSKLYECDTTSGNTSCSRFIWAGSMRIALVPDSTSAQNCNPACYFHTDHLGSSNVMTGPTGTLVETMTYFPYGEVKSDTPGTPVNVPYKYTGKERDTSTGLYYYEARYYDPALGRFISADTIVPNPSDPQDLNRYTYARNNPMYYTDPSGHCPMCVVIAIGVVAGAVSSGIQSDWNLGATMTGAFIGGVSAAAGYGAFGPAAASFSSLGPFGSGIAGGIVAGAVAGATGGVLANMAGYNVNVGLAIASGAAAGGIVGGAGAQWGQLGAFAAAPAAGASSAAISGADPGMGAVIAAATAAFAIGVNTAVHWEQIMNNAKAGMLNRFGETVEVSTPSGVSVTTSKEMTSGLVRGSTSINGSVPLRGSSQGLFSIVEGVNSMVDGAVIIKTAIHGYGAASVGMNGILGGASGMEAMLIRSALVVNGASGLGLAFGGGYMLGTGINHVFPGVGDAIDYQLNQAYQRFSQ
jgi:RHS repeat-associated protein